ncbi:MAG: NAD(P)/FAD-dependent oxidoreductase [Spirochaetales bacterium]|nr:NAD(P)/FAD-dependent oxidoreductase [Spirochaetales bacterium]
MERFDIAVIGGGAVGLAAASVLSKRFSSASLLLVEQHDSFGRETSSRNSEVIHAGIYYPQNTLKATLCVRGRHLLYEFLQQYEVSYSKLGKLIVATDTREAAMIDALMEKAFLNGVPVQPMTQKEIASAEPHINAVAGLFSPETGIFDTHRYMKQLETLAKSRDVMFAYNCRVTGIEKNTEGYTLLVTDADGIPVEIEAAVIINTAGLSSDRIAEMAGIDIDNAGLRMFFSKGEYFTVSGVPRNLLSHLVYPVPGLASLGIHIVLDLGGGIKLGPNQAYVNGIDYTVDPAHIDEFYTAAKRYLPFIEKENLSPDMAGMRPKLQRPDESFHDFYIQEESERGMPGLVNCIGIESPGLTSSLAIAEYILKIL